MSGGSMNYFFAKFDYECTFPENTPLRRAFRKHLELVAQALHDIEWVDSGDWGRGDEEESIKKCLVFNQVEFIEEEKDRLLKEIEILKEYINDCR